MRFKDKIRAVISRSYSIDKDLRINKLNQITVGWVNYYGKLADAKNLVSEINEWIRRRLRMCI